MAVRGVAGQALFELSGNLNQKELKNVDHTVLRFHLSRFFDFCFSLCLCIYSVFFQIVLTQNVSVLCFILTRCLPALWSIYARRRGKSLGPLASYAVDHKAAVVCFVFSCAFHSLLKTGTDREDPSSAAAHALLYSRCNGNADGLVCYSDNQGPIQLSCGSLHWY